MASQAAPPQKQPPAKKAKKVWTNDDLEALRPGGATSSEAPAAPAPPAAGETPAAGESADKAAPQKQAGESPVELLRKRLAAVRADLDSVEAQLRSLRGARTSGNTTGGGVDVNKTTGGMNTEDQIVQLEKQRADLLRQIADIEDEARRAGMAPGAVR